MMHLNSDTSSTVFYGIYIPPDAVTDEENEEIIHVYTDKIEALKIVKKVKKARFKGFKTYNEAKDFTQYGAEPLNSSLDHENVSGLISEKPCLFKGPKSQELVKFRKCIENGDLERVKETVWDNPRYLISSGDTPAILQEGSRYNALHIATKAMNAKICELILDIVSNAEFMQLLYGDDNLEACQDRANILLDLYLNTPDKGLNETPLHFAVKFGAVDCVEVLVSYPQCDKTLKNKYNNTPKEMICQRSNNADQNVRYQIASMLEERYYVPVLRSEDDSIQPIIGEPFSPCNPLKLKSDPMSPRLEIRAYAGPMKKEEAINFRKVWKKATRIRNPRLSRSLQLESSFNTSLTPKQNLSYRILNTEKGLEKFGRDLVHNFNIKWHEYWPFLNTFADFSTKEGLDLLENYIKEKFNTVFSKLYEKNETDCSITSKTMNTTNKTSFKKIWSPIQDLCAAFRSLRILSGSPKDKVLLSPNDTSTNVINNNEDEFSTFLCVEKSLQVIATRIFNAIFNFSSENSDFLNNEFKHFQSLINSYMSDTRFSAVNFQAAHSRIACIIGEKFKEEMFIDDYTPVIQILYEMIDDRNSNSGLYKNSRDIDLRNAEPFTDKYKVCIIQRVIEQLESKTTEVQKQNISTETECKKLWEKCHSCFCSWNDQTFKRNSRRTSSRTKYKKSIEHCNETVSRRLTFEECCENVDIRRGDECFQVMRTTKPINLSHDTLCSSDDEEYFFTPPESPDNSDWKDSDDEQMFDVTDEGVVDVFIEGNFPTKVDMAVYHAVKDITISPLEYPNVYKWRHTIQQYPEDDQIRWQTPAAHNRNMDNLLTSTPKSDHCNRSTVSTPWKRITGIDYSPQSSNTSQNWNRDLNC